MTDGIQTVASQVLILFIIMAIGYIFTRRKLIDENGAGQMTNILLDIVTPCVIINSFSNSFSREMLIGLGSCALLAAAAHILGIIISCFFFRGQSSDVRGILRFSCVYSNCGFMGIPLAMAVFGEEGVIYASAYLAVFNAFSWTQGVSMISGAKKISVKKILINPGTVGILLSLPLVFFSVDLPEQIDSVISMMASLNSPLAMIVIGSFMARSRLKSSFTDKRVYLVAVIRLLIVPITVLLLTWFMDIDPVLRGVLILSASAPTAANSVLLAVMNGKDGTEAGKAVTITTLFSIITIPLMLFLTELI